MTTNRKFFQAAATATIWAIVMALYFAPNEAAVWFAWVLSVGGMGFAAYHWIDFVDKVKRGEITLEDLLMNR